MTPAGPSRRRVTGWLGAVAVDPRRTAPQTEGLALAAEAGRLGGGRWRPLLRHAARLHAQGTHGPRPPLPHDWTEIGPGYPARAFGHWDIAHVAIDVSPRMREHARAQILNLLATQQRNGRLPALVWFQRPGDPPGRPGWWDAEATHPPLWPIAVDDWTRQHRSDQLIRAAYAPLRAQIRWFQDQRAAHPAGFVYVRRVWESGLDDDLRQPHIDSCARKCAAVDATCHVQAAMVMAASWATRLDDRRGAAALADEAERQARFVREQLWDEHAGFFRDGGPPHGVQSFVGFWPLALGIASRKQAARVIDQHLLEPTRFFCAHPPSTIARGDPAFTRTMWRGPVWNSMTYWAARGCLRYGRPDAAQRILARALDRTATEFARTGALWEFYDPDGGPADGLRREIAEPYGIPYREYLGHNPLFAMARLHDAAGSGSTAAP